MAKEIFSDGHVTKDKKAPMCSQCRGELRPVSKRTRHGWLRLGGTLLLIILLAVANGCKRSDSQSPGTNSGSEATPAAAAAQSPTEPLSPQDALIAICEKYHPGYPVEGVYVPATSTEPATFTATMSQKTVLIAVTAINYCAECYCRAAKAAFAQDPQLGRFACAYETTFKDSSGAETKEPYLRIEMSRATAEPIDCPNTTTCNLSKIVDVWYVHPSMLAAWEPGCP